jgi:hypothetical protein
VGVGFAVSLTNDVVPVEFFVQYCLSVDRIGPSNEDGVVEGFGIWEGLKVFCAPLDCGSPDLHGFSESDFGVFYGRLL